MVWTCNEKKRGVGKNSDGGNGSIGDGGAGKTKTEMDGWDQRGHEGEGI